MKKFILTLLILISLGLNAQENSRIRFGGNVIASFGNNFTNLGFLPRVGYLVSDKLELGAGVGYLYTSANNFKSNLFQMGPYANYYISPEIFASTAYEFYTGNQKFDFIDSFGNRIEDKVNFDENALWIGGGYQNNGPVRFQVGVMYNVLWNEDDSIFGNAFRPFAGVSFGL